ILPQIIDLYELFRFSARHELAKTVSKFNSCNSVHQDKLANGLIMSIGASPSVKSYFAASHKDEFAEKPSYVQDAEYTTASVTPLSKISFAGVPVSKFQAITCSEGACGVVIYSLRFDGLKPADKAALKAAVSKSPKSTKRPEFFSKNNETYVHCSLGE
ncbi:MAG: hypothetical protein QM674_18525, partial [Burkholderiaceae bacterium]